MAAGGGEAQVCVKPDIAARYLPDAGRHAVLQVRLQRFRQTYQQLKPLSLAGGKH
jgi:xylulokinase